MTDKQVVLLTGASSGIGKITARKLLLSGYTVYAAARRIDRMNDLLESGAKLLAMDITNDASMVSGVHQIISIEGRIDILINNAGYGSYGAIEDVPIDEARRQFNVNVFGMARLIQLVLPHMRQQQSGKIINIASIAGKIYMPFGGWYHSSKHAVEGLSDCLRVELQPFGIKVVIIEPGPIRTEWDGIAADHLLKTSGKTAYAVNANAFGRMLGNSYQPSNSSPADVVANKIMKAIKARNPKTRYTVGKMAGTYVFLRWLLSDRIFDKVLESELKRRSKT
jgi:NAD(P)-dependent dehydrogenase (short-subunit alcohol dehydrogenase family)